MKPRSETVDLWNFLILKKMEYRIYYNYKVYENGNVENNKGVILKPQIKNEYLFYELKIYGKIKRVSCGRTVMFAFKILPMTNNEKVHHIDGNKFNNSLTNLIFK